MQAQLVCALNPLSSLHCTDPPAQCHAHCRLMCHNWCLHLQMGGIPEDVVLYFGIIDILQVRGSACLVGLWRRILTVTGEG